MATGLGRKAVQGIAAGIGLVSEARSARKTKKQNQQQEQSREIPAPETERGLHQQHEQYEAPPSYEPEGAGMTPLEKAPSGSLEEQWALDEVQEELQHSTPGLLETQERRGSPERIDEEGLAHRFAAEYPAPPSYSTIQEGGATSRPQLSAPVVLPQRRPKNRDRGFIRAYAPALNECGIDQDMFIDFLNTAEKACQGSPWLNAINLASIGTMWMPTVTGIAVSIAIQLATDVALAVDGRRK
jgi:hypothetical protein